MYYAIIDSATNRLVNFTNIPIQYDGCYFIEQEYDPSLIGKKYENGIWIDSSDPYQSEHGKWMSTILGPNKFTAEEWLTKEGYGPTQLVALLDLYATLSAAGKSSVKLNAVKTWTNSVLAEYVQNSQPKSDWGATPFTFNETVIEAYQELGQ